MEDVKGLEQLHKRYLNLNKQTFSCLKNKGFTKKGKKYFKEQGDLILEMSAFVPRPTYNSDDHYIFELGYRVLTLNSSFLEAYRLLDDPKAKVGLIIANGFDKYDRSFNCVLRPTDPPGLDEHVVQCFQKEILEDILPWFATVSTLADLTEIAEKELSLERKDRRFFRIYNIKLTLLMLYMAQGLKDKAYGLFDLYIQGVPETSRHLAEKDVKKIIKYFEDKEKLS